MAGEVKLYRVKHVTKVNGLEVPDETAFEADTMEEDGVRGAAFYRNGEMVGRVNGPISAWHIEPLAIKVDSQKSRYS